MRSGERGDRPERDDPGHVFPALEPGLDLGAGGFDLGRQFRETGRGGFRLHRLPAPPAFLQFHDERGEGDESLHLGREPRLAGQEVEPVTQFVEEEDVVHPPLEGEGLEIERLDPAPPVREKVAEARVPLE